MPCLTRTIRTLLSCSRCWRISTPRSRATSRVCAPTRGSWRTSPSMRGYCPLRGMQSSPSPSRMRGDGSDVRPLHTLRQDRQVAPEVCHGVDDLEGMRKVHGLVEGAMGVEAVGYSVLFGGCALGFVSCRGFV